MVLGDFVYIFLIFFLRHGLLLLFFSSYEETDAILRNFPDFDPKTIRLPLICLANYGSISRFGSFFRRKIVDNRLLSYALRAIQSQNR